MVEASCVKFFKKRDILRENRAHVCSEKSVTFTSNSPKYLRFRRRKEITVVPLRLDRKKVDIICTKVDVRKWRDGRFSDSPPLFSFLVTLTSIRIVSILPIFAISLPRILTLSLPPLRLLFRYLLRRRISRLISLGDRVV